MLYLYLSKKGNIMSHFSEEDRLLNIDIIKKDNLIDRASDIYKRFEKKINHLSKNKKEIEENFECIAYLFCQECHYRDIKETHTNHQNEENDLISFDISYDDMFYIEKDKETDTTSELYLGKTIISKASKTTKSNLNSLYNLNKTLFNYFWNITSQTLKTTPNKDSRQGESRYKVINQINKEDLISAIGKQRAFQVARLDEGEVYMANKIDIQEILPKLTEEEKQQILYTISSKYKFHLNTELKTYIMSNDVHITGYKHLSKTMFVELDLSKPKKQLINYLEYLIDEYNKEAKPIQNIGDLLEKGEKYDEDMSNLLKINKDIPLGVKLADLLYTYDCQYASYSLNNVLDELNGYHYEFYKIENDKNRRSSVDNWSKIIKKYIDEKKYLQYYGQPINGMSESIASQIDRAEEEYFFNKFNF